MASKRKKIKKKSTAVPSAPERKGENTVESETADLTEKVLEHLPHLVAEMERSEADVRIDGVRWEETDRTRQPISTNKTRFSGYSPDVVDFLRRCTTEEEALEVIEFLEKRGEISSVHAREIRKQLRSRGVRSFGSKKSWGHYERED
jgi:hypothetical protein